MPELNSHDIEQISQDINRQGISFSHLRDDLIDYVCCDVENEMQDGLSFSEAYQKVKHKMGSNRLKEIQNETLYAVDTKYRNMKNTMKISGIVGTILFGFATLFKIQHWSGAGIMMTLGALTLTFAFMPSALVVLWKETHSPKRLFLFVSAFFTGTFIVLGILFKVQHWPAAGIILSIGMLCGILLFIPSLIINRFADKDKKLQRPVFVFGSMGLILYVAGIVVKIQHWPSAGTLMIPSIILLCISLIWYSWLTWKDENYVSSRFIFLIISAVSLIIPGALINVSLQYSYEDGYYPNLEQQQEMNDYLNNQNNSFMLTYRDSASFPKLEQIHSGTTGLLSTISNIQVKMVQESEGKPGVPAVSDKQIRTINGKPVIQYRLLSKPFQPNPVQDYLLPESGRRQELNTALAEYRRSIALILQGRDEQWFTSLLDPATYLTGIKSGSRTVSLISGLHSLELLKNGILTAELNALKSVAGKN